MITPAIKRGTAELAVLSVLENGALHGYEIARRIEQQTKGSLRFTLAAPETARGLRQIVLAAAPLPALPEAPAPGPTALSCTKKSVFLALYRAHPHYGDRSRASRVAAELAPQAGLQPGTARSYLYAELDGRRP